jgi:DNA-binding NtrC family response regulator
MHQESTAALPMFAEPLHTTSSDSSPPSAVQPVGESDLDGTFSEAKARVLERFERAYLEALVQRCGGNLSKASRQAGIARNHLRALLKKLGLYDRRYANTAAM